MNHKLAPKVREKFIARIGEVEATLGKPQAQVFRPAPTTAQAPSMQRIIDEQIEAPVAPPRKIIPTEVITSTTNGGSTKGPRKW